MDGAIFLGWQLPKIIEIRVGSLLLEKVENMLAEKGITKCIALLRMTTLS
jgi:hypothetical protein